jgi:tRNA(Ile)-lysidine synthase
MRTTPLAAEVRRVLRESGIPSAGETIVSALSGGADSVALLDALAWLGAVAGFRVVAAHLDHGLRPDAGADAAFCQDLCARLGVVLRAGASDVRARARRERGGIEEAGRDERYEFLRRVRREEGAVAIAVAHTRDDQAETFLLRLLRGAGHAGLAGMRARSGDLIRPLLGISREQVLAHLQARGLPWREDPTNAQTAFLRNRVRHELIPYLESRVNPRIRETLARTAALLQEEAELLDEGASALLVRLGRKETGGVVLSLEGLKTAPRALARLALRRALEGSGGLRGVAELHIERILDLAASAFPSGRRLPLPGGREALFRFGELWILPRAPAERPFAMPLQVPGRVVLPGGALAVEARASTGPAVSNNETAVVVGVPEEPLVVRTRRGGDRLRLGGRELSLRRFMMDRRIPADLRARLPLVAAGRRVLWIPGQAAPAPPEPGSRLVHLEVRELRP